jgi:RNA polymerase sigma-70 factor (ECF subfamily)
MPTAAIDEVAIERLRAGDPDAYEQLVRVHRPRLLAVARRLLRHEDDARDAVQEAFLLAFRGLSSFGERCRLSTWLHRIVVNAALMQIRARERRHEVLLGGTPAAVPVIPGREMAADEWRLPAPERLLRDERCGQLRGAIARLPEGYRTVIVLRDIEEVPTPDVARQLRLSPNAVKIRLYRARQALRALLDPVRLQDAGGAATSRP